MAPGIRCVCCTSAPDTKEIEDEIAKVQAREVELKSGGSIVIEQTEALVAIDVNSGRCVGQKTLEETILKHQGKSLPDDLLRQAKRDGFADRYLARLLGVPEKDIRDRRLGRGGPLDGLGGRAEPQDLRVERGDLFGFIGANGAKAGLKELQILAQKLPAQIELWIGGTQEPVLVKEVRKT